MIMKVKKLIEELSKLDQEKNIWVLYDSYYIFDPIPDDVADEEDVEQFKDDGVKLGDYIISAG